MMSAQQHPYSEIIEHRSPWQPSKSSIAENYIRSYERRRRESKKIQPSSSIVFGKRDEGLTIEINQLNDERFAWFQNHEVQEAPIPPSHNLEALVDESIYDRRIATRKPNCKVDVVPSAVTVRKGRRTPINEDDY